MNLYTSDSKFLRYLVLSVASVLAISFLCCISLIRTTEVGEFNVQGYQRQQLKDAGKVDVVFVGDSSLGNAIHDDYFTEISGLKTVNMATTGFFGFEGSYNFIKQVHRVNPDIKLIVVSQTFDLMKRPVSYEGYLRTFFFNDGWRLSEIYNDFKDNPRLALGMGSQMLRTFFDTRNVFRAIREWNVTRTGQRKALRDVNMHDFFGKPAEFRLPDPDKEILQFKVNPDKIYFLGKIADYCHDNKLNCVFMNAPYYDKGIKANKEYAEQSDKLFAEATEGKMKYIRPFWSFPRKDAGNSLDHLYYKRKKEYTRQALQRLKKAKAL